MRLPPLGAVLGIAAVMPACGGDGAGDAGVERSDSAGVEIVVNRGPDRALDWTFTPILALGGEDEGPEAFYRVGAGVVDVDGDGNLYIYDRDNHRLVSFDAGGTVRWMAGKEGGGPGEFNFVFSLYTPCGFPRAGP